MKKKKTVLTRRTDDIQFVIAWVVRKLSWPPLIISRPGNESRRNLDTPWIQIICYVISLKRFQVIFNVIDWKSFDLERKRSASSQNTAIFIVCVERGGGRQRVVETERLLEVKILFSIYSHRGNKFLCKKKISFDAEKLETGR